VFATGTGTATRRVGFGTAAGAAGRAAAENRAAAVGAAPGTAWRVCFASSAAPRCWLKNFLSFGYDPKKAVGPCRTSPIVATAFVVGILRARAKR